MYRTRACMGLMILYLQSLCSDFHQVRGSPP
jgi:hypothetical protein